MEKLEIIEKFLTKRVSEPKYIVLEKLKIKFALKNEEAEKIYINWRRKYVAGEIEEYDFKSFDNSLEVYAEKYAVTNRKGLTEKEIINIVKAINKYGVPEATEILGIKKKDVITVYANAKCYGLINIRRYEGKCKRDLIKKAL